MRASHPPLYRERPPAPALAPWIERVWRIRGRLAPGAEVARSVLPDGCMDVIFDLATGSGRGADRHFAIGTMTRPLPVTQRGAVHLVGVRFRPGGARAFLDLPARELVDGRAPLDDLWGPLAGEIWERLGGGDDGALESLLRGLVGDGRARGGPGRGRDDALVRRAAALLDAPAPPRPGALLRATGLGRRQLERRFADAVGVGPGALQRILRFRRAAERVRRGGAGLARIALEAGYHDQPHMNRDFRALAGESPGALRARPDPVRDASVQDDGLAAW